MTIPTFLTTFEFQARAFYEARVYREAGRLVGYPPGSTYYWMRKELLPDPPEATGWASRITGKGVG